VRKIKESSLLFGQAILTLKSNFGQCFTVLIYEIERIEPEDIRKAEFLPTLLPSQA